VALRTGEGFIKVTGEVGTGKTLLCRKLLNSLDERFVTAYIPNPAVTPASLRMALAEELGIECSAEEDQHQQLKQIAAKLLGLGAEGKQAVVLLDEAQALSDDCLETVRLLTNLETEKRKLLQVVMFGQPELDQRLARPELRQLRQRISFSCKLEPLDPQSLAGYVTHRLIMAGYAGPPIFSAGALRTLQRASHGTPRVANMLCHKALIVAFGRGAHRITPGFIRLAARETEGAWRTSWLPATSILFITLAASALLALHNTGFWQGTGL